MGYFQELYLHLQEASNPFALLLELFRAGLWIVFFPLFIWMVRLGWLEWVQNMYRAKQQFVLMAVDVPKVNEQSMKAVEQIIATLHGVFFGPNKKEKWWLGVLLDKFSLEIVSIDGYIQYFVYSSTTNADLVKGAIYAQYPDAEIIEVEDYTQNVPLEYPNEEYDVFGTEFLLRKPDVFPIKTYEQFEHQLTGVYADPMAAVLELMSRLRKGEQVWLQFVLTPQGGDFRERGLKEVDKLIGKKVATAPDWVDNLLNAPLKTLEVIHESVFSTGLDYSQAPGATEADNGNFLNMTTGEKLIVEEVQKKLSRHAFRWKFRFLYIGKKDVFDPGRVAGSVYGAIEQFNTQDLNSIGWGPRTTTHGPTYLFMNRRRDWRKTRLINNYRGRSDFNGEKFQIMSHVEIASIFHFPTEIVKAPLISKASARTSEPPSQLPMENIETVGGSMQSNPQIETVIDGAVEPPMGAVPGLPMEPGGAYPAPGQTSMPKPPPPPPSAAGPDGTRPPQLPPRLSQQAPIQQPLGPASRESLPESSLPPALPVQVPPQQAPSAEDRRDFPLYSMPGLPPGVHPLNQAVPEPPRPSREAIHQAPNASAATPFPPSSTPLPEPAPLPPQQAQPMAPPVQAPAPPVQPPQPQYPPNQPPQVGGGKGAPPTNLPLG